jgi:hypothetical protein
MFGQLLCALEPDLLDETVLVRSIPTPMSYEEKEVVREDEAPPPAYEILDGGANESWLVANESDVGLPTAQTLEKLVTTTQIIMYVLNFRSYFCIHPD